MDEAKPVRVVASPLNGQIPPIHRRFRKGESGNPAGRPNPGSTVCDWLAQMTNWNKREVTAAAKDPKSPNAKAAAARCWLHARSQGLSKAGVPIGGPDLDRILDRFIGRPTQNIHVERSIQQTSEYQELQNLTLDQLREIAAAYEKFKIAAPHVAVSALPSPTPETPEGIRNDEF